MRMKRAVHEVFLELDVMKKVGIIGKNAKDIRELECLVDLQGKVMNELSKEYGTNLVKLLKLKGVFSD